MDSSTGLIIIWLVVLILCSAYFSATETAFSSLNKIRLKNLMHEGNKRAALTLRMSEQYDKLLSSILIGNNVVNIAASSVATVVFLKFFPAYGVTISTVVMTVLVLIFGEISPKSLAKERPESFAMFSAPILRVIMTILLPFNWLFGQWKILLNKIFKTKDDRGITEQELLTMVEEAQNEGGIDAQEGDLIKSAIEFNDLETGDILTPRVDLTAIDIDEDPQALYRIFMESNFSRIPVYKDTIDNIVGVVHQRDFFIMLRTRGQKLTDIIKPVIFVSESIKISRLIKHLQKSQAHMAVVTDEYGGTMGIVTMEDILEELVGEIWDEHDDVIQDIEKLGENEYMVLGGADVEEVFELFGLKCDVEQNTVNGWAMDRLEKLPEVGDSFIDHNLQVTVKELDGRRIGKVLIHFIPLEDDASSDEDDK
ncbi:HlyC/CorC family transporter [Ructibacterium gallinarum]|uniref:HlyC/CorC family transporter n=1 Tax=Ructibacterium gallinarum TaxID=2779355 RepID=A0A9D5M025_9FIRM|nr:hemolysin family protein [Ructibacterium gallinarum]MBE5040162.1 HlyC/CorC family transporter [Ructibacterium gallinarum]